MTFREKREAVVRSSNLNFPNVSLTAKTTSPVQTVANNYVVKEGS